MGWIPPCTFSELTTMPSGRQADGVRDGDGELFNRFTMALDVIATN